MKRINSPYLFAVLSLLSSFMLNLSYADTYPGLPTRSQSPFLQGYFIPAIPSTEPDGWSVAHSLYITNTYQIDQAGTEQAIVDVENTRYDFQLSYAEKLWLFNLNASLIDNRSGFLDQTIESWHDFFGLPQGGRNTAINNQIRLFYQKDSQVLIDSMHADNGLADLQLALGYSLTPQTRIWFGLELPTNSGYEFITNDATDLALWLSSSHQWSEKSTLFGSTGLVLPGNGGLLPGLLEDQFVFGQLGWVYRYSPDYHLLLQADYHSPIIKDSHLDVFDHSLQMQFVLRLPGLIEKHTLDVFFSEDIFPGHAPDITFSLRLTSVDF